MQSDVVMHSATKGVCSTNGIGESDVYVTVTYRIIVVVDSTTKTSLSTTKTSDDFGTISGRFSDESTYDLFRPYWPPVRIQFTHT